MPTYLLGVFFYFAPSGSGTDLFPTGSSWMLLLVVSVYTFLIPVVGAYSMVRLRLVEDMAMSKLSDRRLPVLFTIAVYAGTTYFFGWHFDRVAPIAPVLRVVLGGVTVSIALVGLISSRWQISAHAAGIGGVTGALLAESVRVGDASLLSPLLVAVLLSGWVVAARLQLNAHTASEVAAGYALGAGVCGAAVLLFF